MQTDSHSMFGKNRSRIWPAVITNHITITFEINHPIWGSHPANDPHVGVVYEWESADGIMQPPPGAMVGFFTPQAPISANPDRLPRVNVDCQTAPNGQAGFELQFAVHTTINRKGVSADDFVFPVH